MDRNYLNNAAMHLQNASNEFISLANNSGVGYEETLQLYQDFDRDNQDLTFKWMSNGIEKQLSGNQIHDFLNGNAIQQMEQLLETVTNLEERLESMEFYNDEPQSA